MEIHWRNLKCFSSRTTWPISTKLGTKHSRVKGTHNFTNLEHSILKKEIMGSFRSYWMLWYNHSFAEMCLLIWTGFSSGWFGSWASCLVLHRLTIFGTWVHHHKTMCHAHSDMTLRWPMTSRSKLEGLA